MPRSQVGRSPWSRIQSWSWLSSNWGGQTALVFALTNNCEEAMMIPGPGGGKGNSMEFCLILFGSEWLGICRIMSDPKCTTSTPLQKAFPWWPGTCMTCAFRLLKIDMKINAFFCGFDMQVTRCSWNEFCNHKKLRLWPFFPLFCLVKQCETASDLHLQISRCLGSL